MLLSVHFIDRDAFLQSLDGFMLTHLNHLNRFVDFISNSDLVPSDYLKLSLHGRLYVLNLLEYDETYVHCN